MAFTSVVGQWLLNISLVHEAAVVERFRRMIITELSVLLCHAFGT
jgi:hypothetical protein